MVRINHAASYFMPLYCSSKPYLVAISIFITTFIFASFYISSDLLLKQYDDPTMFNPDSQDYFRTSLLGLFSPFLFYFIKIFIFNITSTHLMENLIIDYLINDWFLLCILISLAYPQVQESNDQNVLYSLDGNVEEQWHIIPRQSYIFGISWALGELIICAISNIFEYQGIANSFDKSDSLLARGNLHNNGLDKGYGKTINNPVGGDEERIHRKDITLSRCVGLRRMSSSISSNVYSSEIEPTKKLHLNPNNYGSIRSHNTKDDKLKDLKEVSKKRKGRYGNLDNSDNILLIDPVDNSLRINSTDNNNEAYQRETVEPILEKHHGINWVKYVTLDGQLSNPPHIKLFVEISTTKELLYCISQLIIIITCNIFLIIGESLLLSIYFIYVRGHERLFSKVVLYFGQQDIQLFLLCVVLPVSILDFLMSILIFFCNDTDEWMDEMAIEHNLASIEFSHYPIRYKSYHPNFQYTGSVTSVDLPGSQLSSSLFTEFRANLNQNSDSRGSWNKSHYFMGLYQLWMNISRKNWFMLGAIFIWSVSMFVSGLVATVTS